MRFSCGSRLFSERFKSFYKSILASPCILLPCVGKLTPWSLRSVQPIKEFAPSYDIMIHHFSLQQCITDDTTLHHLTHHTIMPCHIISITSHHLTQRRTTPHPFESLQSLSKLYHQPYLLLIVCYFPNEIIVIIPREAFKSRF